MSDDTYSASSNQATLIRLRRTDHGTEGTLICWNFHCCSLELSLENNQWNSSCISAERLIITVLQLPKYKLPDDLLYQLVVCGPQNCKVPDPIERREFV